MADDQATEPGGSAGGSDAALGQSVSRGQFLTKATIGMGAVLGGMVAVPPVAMMLAPAVGGQRRFRVPALDEQGTPIRVEDLPVGEFAKFVLHFPEELPTEDERPRDYVRDRVGFVRRNPEGFTDALTGKSEQLTLISNRCVHLGCPVQETGGQFVCPCHGGAYDGDGQRTEGPPPRPLDRFDWEVGEDGYLYVTGEHSLTPDGRELDSVYGPGQPTAGPQSLFFKFQP